MLRAVSTSLLLTLALGATAWGQELPVGPTPAEATESFAPARRGPSGEIVRGFVPDMLVEEVFKEVRQLAEARTSERLAAARTPADRAVVERGLTTLRELRLELIETNDLRAERVGNSVRLSHGLLTEIYQRSMHHMDAGTIDAGQRGPFQMRILGLILGHEVARASGIRAERVADAEALELMKRSAPLKTVTQLETREALLLFEAPTGSPRIDNLFSRLRGLLRYGTPGGRARALERARTGQPDRFASYRRADGTVRWSEATRAGVLREGKGAATFALALFLKELAVVARTGDRLRIEEFFDTLLTTDFYARYGMFVAGARIGEVAYTRFLQRYVKPQFLNGVLKTNLVLAAGIALPLIVEGQFEARTFAISVTSLGLSTAAVRGGMASIRWALSLEEAKSAGLLGKVGAGAGRLARLGGWVYTIAELAVILYVSDAIETRARDALTIHDARSALTEAGEAFVQAATDTEASVDSLEEAAGVYRDAWTQYRNVLYRRLDADEALLAQRLKRLARAAKLTSDTQLALEQLAGHPALRAHLEQRAGTLEAFGEELSRADRDDLHDDLDAALSAYNQDRDAHLREVYEEGRRGTPLLAGVGHLDWLLGAAPDPWGARKGLIARSGRASARRSLRQALDRVSLNRIESYDDEAEVFAHVARALRSQARVDLAQVVDAAQASALRVQAADVRLYAGDGSVATEQVGLDDVIRGPGTR